MSKRIEIEITDEIRAECDNDPIKIFAFVIYEYALLNERCAKNIKALEEKIKE